MQADRIKEGSGEQPYRNYVPPNAPWVTKSSFFTILVADAKALYKGPLENFLSAEGHFVIRADTPDKAMIMAKQYQPDLILLDTELESAGSLALMSDLLLEQNAAAVILLARDASVADAVAAMKHGAADYLERPLDLKKLKAAIDTQKELFNYVFLGFKPSTKGYATLDLKTRAISVSRNVIFYED